MSPCPSLSLLLLVFFLTSLHAASPDGRTTNDLVHQTCKKCAQEDPNVSYQFCVASLESNPKSRRTDLRGLGLISIKLLQRNVTCTRSYAKKLLNRKKMDPSIKACLRDCLDLYSDAVPTLEEAIRAYEGKKY